MAKRGYDGDDDRSYHHKRHRDDDDGNEVPALYSIFSGEIASVQKYGCFVKIPGYKKQGLVHKSQMSQARIDDPSEMVSVREKVYCKVISIEGEHQKIGLSMKAVNQTTGQDRDPNNVQASLDERKRKQGFFGGERPRIELGAIYDTNCARCGGHGHLSKDCFVEKGGKQYDLIPDLDKYVPESPSSPTTSSPKKKKKKDKKHKKEKKKKKKHRHSQSSDDSDSDRNSSRKKHKRSSEKKKRRDYSSDSSGR